MKLHGYFRSSATYRVRVALNLKGLSYENVFHHLRRGEQRSQDYLGVNPQGLVPALQVDGEVFTQSLAICEYLDERYPEPPLLPKDPAQRAHARAVAQVIACEVHPIQNLKILNRLRSLGLNDQQVNAWAVQAITEGFDTCEALMTRQRSRFCFGDAVSLADLCIVPQLYNARRFGVELKWPRLLEVEAACLELDAFRRAAPEQQPDAE